MLSNADAGVFHYRYMYFPSNEVEIVIHTNLLPMVDNNIHAAIILAHFVDMATISGAVYINNVEARAIRHSDREFEETRWSTASPWILVDQLVIMTEDEVKDALDFLVKKNLLITQMNENGHLIARPSPSLEGQVIK